MIRRALPVTLAVGVIAMALLLVFGLSTGATAQQEGNTVTVTGYVTQYLDDDELMFTDGASTVKIEIENGSARQLPLNTPITMTVQIKEAEGNNKFEVNLVSWEPVKGPSADSSAKAQPQPATALPVTTVAEIKAKPINNQRVVLSGQITQKIGEENYLFNDGTGMIVLDVDDDLPANAIPMNQPLIIFGQVDVEDGRVEVDVIGIQSPSGGAAIAPTGDDDNDDKDDNN